MKALALAHVATSTRGFEKPAANLLPESGQSMIRKSGYRFSEKIMPSYKIG